ncbi:LysR family transcriptional regulator [Dechloromonas sp. XY25]|uniref:LysR family transcriptional regulator n=1 Tax=Dechloromonas hankyongensis TaxID=2908002 RepID=A0ABS9K228_9RHOO|nr:LysR family transcriptional regulator [Dechloromonas hankyongensis]MCG2577230.1 LysR family transcriptional regulator [Dechloromonas hankyongensis]
MNIKPQLEDLRLFCTVVRLGSFAASARELGISKAVVSKRMALLEVAVHATLLHRTTRRVTLTAQGDIVHQWAQRILDDVDQMGEALSLERAAPAGLLRICSSLGFGRNRLAPALSALARQYPALEIQVELFDRPVDLVEEGFQLDVRLGAVSEGNVMARRIARNHRILCAAPAYLAERGTPVRLDELKAHHCIAIRERDQEFGRWNLSGPQGMETIRVGGPLSANNGEIVRQWAVDGHGIILRSLWDAAADIASGRLVRILPDYVQEADVWAVYPSRLSTSARLRVCVEFLEGWFAGEAGGAG